MSYTLNLREVTYGLSEALDYVGIDDTMHGKRVAYMSAEMAKKLNWEKERIDQLLMAGMLHDCGVSSTDVHHHLVTELDWDNSQIHCERGYELLKKVEIYKEYAEIIKYHHTHWEELDGMLDEKTRYHANMIYIADRIDALRVQFGYQLMEEKNAIRDMIQKYSGTMFSPELVDVFLEISVSDSFWFFMESESLAEYFEEWIDLGQEEEISFEILRNVAMMFANVVDAKSPFTAEHTFGVASLARYIANLASLPQKVQENIELSAFFHDLGKLRVDDAILHKNGPLDDKERSQMNRHGFDTDVILRKIKGFKEISKIASMHHETLDAKGYPYRLSEKQIPIEARIVAVADIFQALVQNRPYRNGLSATDAYTILNDMRHNNKLDPNIVDLVEKHLDNCYEYAMCQKCFR